MIIKAKERGGGAQLARYLLTMRDNDHVELHEVRGFVSDDLRGAFCEADAIAAGTRYQNHLFSISLNPPQHSTVTAEEFEAAANEVERKLGLEGQPRAIVFHEKVGRRHAHVVWSRSDAERMTQEQKQEFLRAMFSVVMTFVELGFGVHPLQQVDGREPCGQVEKASHQGPKDAFDRVRSTSIPKIEPKNRTGPKVGWR